jgi:hypothetical protein
METQEVLLTSAIIIVVGFLAVGKLAGPVIECARLGIDPTKEELEKELWAARVGYSIILLVLYILFVYLLPFWPIFAIFAAVIIELHRERTQEQKNLDLPTHSESARRRVLRMMLEAPGMERTIQNIENSAQVYPGHTRALLRQLKHELLVKSHEVGEPGSSRQLYSLTDLGIKRARRELKTK